MMHPMTIRAIRRAVLCAGAGGALVALAVTILGAAPGPTPQIATRDVRDFVGSEFTACGRVVSFNCSRLGDTVLLDFATPEDGRRVSIGVRSAQRPAFGERFEDPFLGADACATGRVERLEQRFVIVVDTPASLTLQKPGPPDAMLGGIDRNQSCGTGIQIPILVREVKPLYSPDAMRAKIQGTVKLQAVVLADGKVGSVRVVGSLDPSKGLDAAAVTAAKQWQFEPGQWRGRVVPMVVKIDLTFTLK